MIHEGDRITDPDTGRYIEVITGTDGQFYPHLRAANHETVFAGEGYTRKADAWQGLRIGFPDFFRDEGEQDGMFILPSDGGS